MSGRKEFAYLWWKGNKRRVLESAIEGPAHDGKIKQVRRIYKVTDEAENIKMCYLYDLGIGGEWWFPIDKSSPFRTRDGLRVSDVTKSMAHYL